MVIVRKKKSRKTTLSTESEKTLDWVMCKTCTAQQITGFSHSPEGLY